MRACDIISEMEMPHNAHHAHHVPQTSSVVRKAHYSDAQIVAACLVGEAGDQGTNGMVAVMNVISNRAHGNPSKFKSVVLSPKQFSMFNGRTPEDAVHKAKRHPLWPIAVAIVDKSNSKSLKDITVGSTHYYAPKRMAGKVPSWAAELEKTITLGDHVFFK